MNNERTASYMGGLVYKKVNKSNSKYKDTLHLELSETQPIASHLTLLKEKIKLSIDQQTYSLQIQHTSSPLLSPDKNSIHSPHFYHMDPRQAH